ATVVRMSMANSGQACVSQSRLIVPRSLLGAVLERASAAMATQWPLGDPSDPATRLGPVATAGQGKRVRAMIERAQADGARLVAGGSAAPEGFAQGHYVRPTLFADVLPTMEIAQEEVFGPVLGVLAYDSEAEAVQLANATRYGL